MYVQLASAGGRLTVCFSMKCAKAFQWSVRKSVLVASVKEEQLHDASVPH
jgi:hypothetical protein